MKTINKFFSVIAMLLFMAITAAAQTTPDVQATIKEGVALHNAGKYDDAIAKFDEVLKTDPENGFANYEIAFSMYAAKRPKEAILHLGKAVKSDNQKLAVASYVLLGSIYDEDHQTQKAIDAYNAGIKINPDYPQIFYNLGVTCFRNQQFAEAEASSIEAIKHDPKNASSQRLYALVCFHQNKRMNALLGLCSFLLLEPNTQRSVEAYNNIESILKGGILKEDGHTTITISPSDAKETGTYNMGISMVVLSAQQKKLEGVDLLEYELTSCFKLAGELADKKTQKSFFDRFFVDYFYNLAKTDNMPAFTRTITLTVNKEASAAWGKEHVQQLNSLSDWLGKTEREF